MYPNYAQMEDSDVSDQKYLEALRAGVEQFDELRKQDPEATVDLTGADLSGLDLQRAPFQRVVLQDVIFEGANLTGANLSRATLAGARFKDADITGANLHRTEMEGADMRGAALTDLEGRSQVCLHPCIFKGTRWSKEHMESFLAVLNQNQDWEIKFQVVPKSS